MKQEFLNFLNALMSAAPEVVENMMSDNIQMYIDALSEVETTKVELTDNGKLILNYLQQREAVPLKAKDIAAQLDVSSRTVSGSMRKLVADKFVEKVGKDPILYLITEKGKEFKIED